jgi:hypothetical protein
MVYTHVVTREVERYLAGERPLRELALWMARVGRELRDSEPRAAALDPIRSFELALAEYTAGHLSREALHDRLSGLVGEWRGAAETTWTCLTEPRRRASTAARTEFEAALA